jgi:TPP-dependent pyruvate/acetoin dehydrogenase alpha subunit
MAAIWNLPVIFVVENNQYASTTSKANSSKVRDLYMRAVGYGMPGEKIDGNALLAVRKATTVAIERARAGEGPTFLENVTYRMKGHFEGDPQKYRKKEEVESWREKDPIERFARLLIQNKALTEKLRAEILKNVQVELDAAFAFAQDSPFPEPEDALTDLYCNMEGGRHA